MFYLVVWVPTKPKPNTRLVFFWYCLEKLIFFFFLATS